MPNDVFGSDVTYLATATYRVAPKLPAGSIGNTEFNAGAPLDATKAQQEYVLSHVQESATPCADEARVIHAAQGAGTIVVFEVGAVVANLSGAVVDIDLLVNGVSVLTAAVQLDAADAAYALVAASIATATYVDAAVFEVSITGTEGAGTLAKGVFCRLVVREVA